MIVKLWGVRGSIAAPMGSTEYQGKLHSVLKHAIDGGLKDESEISPFLKTLPHHLRYIYGGNTTCVTVTSAKNKTYILDGGTGIRPLGLELLKGPLGKGEGESHIFFSHTHWDHIQGLPFFIPFYLPGNQAHFYSPLEDLKERLIRQQASEYFPMPFEGTASTKHFHRMEEKVPLHFDDGMKITCHALKHPGASYAYRFEENGRTFIFATDAEFTGADLDLSNSSDDYTEFFNNADLMVLDAQYTLDESFGKFDWGHTSFTMAVNCSIRWKIKNLVLTHHEPAYSDAKLFENLQEATEHRNQMKSTAPRVLLAREGMTFQVGKGS